MAVSVDTVYQRVLALANKEQRGYITPQEFNLFANQAQMEIFEQYFYDLDQWSRRPDNNESNSNISEFLEEKMELFLKSGNLTAQGTGNGLYLIPSELYRIIDIYGVVQGVTPKIIEKVSFRDVKLMMSSRLSSPTTNSPIWYIQPLSPGAPNFIRILPTTFISVQCHYMVKPSKVEWGYFVINDKALYDGSTSKTTNFELHPSEETELVYKILKLAGVSMKKLDIMRAGQIQEQSQVQQEKQ